MSDPTKIYLNPVEKDPIKQNSAVRQLIECASDDRSTIKNAPIFVAPFTTKNFYVSPSGNNSNDGLTVSTPWLTLLQAAVSVLDGYFAPNSTAQINLANGTYTVPAPDGSGAYFGTPMNWGQINFVGNPGSPSSVIIDGSLLTNGQAFYISQNSSGVTVGVNGVQIQNFPSTGGGQGRGFNCQSVTGTFQPQNIIFAGNVGLCFGIEGGFVEVEGPLTFSGTNQQAVYANGTITMVDFNAQNITFSGGAAFSFAYLNVDNGATMSHSVGTVTGTCTGTQFFIAKGGRIHASSGGSDQPPSAIPGTASSGIIQGGWFNNNFGNTPVAVANLPTGVTAGIRATVNNATATTFWSIVAGGGGNTVPVTYDGTNWRIG